MQGEGFVVSLLREQYAKFNSDDNSWSLNHDVK